MFYKCLLALVIIGGLNWGSCGLFGFDFVGWATGGSLGLFARIIFVVVGAAAVCLIPQLFTGETGGKSKAE